LDVVARHAVAVAIAFLGITYLHVVFGEQAPKAVAIMHPEQAARWLIRPLILFTNAGRPLIWAINASANWLLRLFRVRVRSEAERVHRPEEILMLVRRSRELGMVAGDEQAMISGVFELTQTIVREVMTPRPDIVAVPAGIGYDELIATVSRCGHSRLPVYEGNLDKVVGIVLAKDLLRIASSGAVSDFDVSRIMREPYFVPDSKPVDDLLAEFLKEKVHLAIVVDEFGGTAGLVSLEDLLEEIVGEIYDEYDVARPIFTTTARGEPLIDGGAPIDEVNERYSLGLPEENYDTLGGFILGELGHVPKPGDEVRLDGATLVVERVDERRVRTVRLVRRPQGSKQGTGARVEG
jgi:CBS domain containing-hemolysin-like protein